MAIQCTCLECGATFERFPRGIRRGEGKYCSKVCAQASRKRSGNRLFMPDGYIKVYQSGGRMIAEHRLVLQQHLGRELRDDELVHHIDGNKSNNDIANLQVVSAREHSAIHLTLKDRWAKEHDRCVECGTTERRHLANGLCFRCHNRNYARQWRRERRAGYYAARFGLPDDRESVLPNIDALIAMGQGREE